MATESPTALPGLPKHDGTPMPPTSVLRRRLRVRATQLHRFVQIIGHDPLTLLGFIIVVLAVSASIVIEAVPFFSQLILGHTISVLPYNPFALSSATSQGPSAAHWLGTDRTGRDIFSLVMSAMPLDIGLGVGIAGFGLLVGGGLGLVAGYWDNPRTLGGLLSAGILRLTDVFLAMPTIVLTLAIATTLGPTLTTIFLALAITWWPYYVRLVRAEVLAVKPQLFVAAARAAGVSERRILFRHVVRNLVEPVIEYYTLDIGSVIITFSTLLFIIPVTLTGVAEWGFLVSEYQSFFLSLPWTVLAPGVAIFVTVLGFSLLGDGIQNALDPRAATTVAPGR
ncbi:MAG: ABC transporter permease [Thermoplasmata archaeon]